MSIRPVQSQPDRSLSSLRQTTGRSGRRLEEQSRAEGDRWRKDGGNVRQRETLGPWTRSEQVTSEGCSTGSCCWNNIQSENFYLHLTRLILALSVMVFIHQYSAQLMNKLVKEKGTSAGRHGKDLLRALMFPFTFLLPFLTLFSRTVTPRAGYIMM